MCVQNYIFASPSVSLPVSLSSTSVFLILLSPDRSGRGQTSSETEKNSSISLLNEVVATVVVTRGETRHDEQHSAMGGVIVIRMSYVSVPVFHILDRNGRCLLDFSRLRVFFVPCVPSIFGAKILDFSFPIVELEIEC